MAEISPVEMPSLSRFAISGVYFLYRDSVVVYVGQAVDVRRRLGDHIGEGVKVFDAVSMIECPPHRLLTVERHYIKQLLPEYNVCSYSKGLRYTGAYALESHPWPNKLEPAEAARYLGIDLETLSKWRKEGRVPPLIKSPRCRAGQYPLDGLRKFAARVASDERR